MGTTLTGLQVGSTYSGLLKTTDNAIISGVLRTITDGLGNDTALSVSSAGVKSSGTLEVTGVATLTAQPILSALTASSAVATDASKGLVSVANTGTGSNVLATSPTLVTPILGTPTSGNLANCTGYVGTSALVTVGALNSGSITAGFGSIDVGADAISGGAISGTTGTFSGAITGPGSTTGGLTLGNASGNTGASVHLLGSSTTVNWQLASQTQQTASFTITPSTTNGGNTYTTPIALFTSTGLAVTGTVDSSGGAWFGTAALATGATTGHVYIQTSAGAPTGVPAAKTGQVAIQFDTTNNKLYIYDGAWLSTPALT